MFLRAYDSESIFKPSDFVKFSPDTLQFAAKKIFTTWADRMNKLPGTFTCRASQTKFGSTVMLTDLLERSKAPNVNLVVEKAATDSLRARTWPTKFVLPRYYTEKK